LRGGVAGLAVALLAACGGDKPTPSAPAQGQSAAQVPAGAAPPPAATPTPAATPVETIPVPQLLRDATQAVAEERLVTPPGNNAVEFYLGVLAQEPQNLQATQALIDIFPLVASIAEREIAQKRLDEAERIVGLLDRASPGSYTVTTIRSKLDAAKAAAEREAQAQLAAQQAAQQEAQQAAQQAAAEAAVAAEPAATPTTAAAIPTPRPAPAASPSPSPATVASTTPATETPPKPTGETRDARVVRQVPPEYPTQAMRKRQEGWVELEFTIGTDGRVKDVAVVRAQPPRIFDKEAVRAVQQFTFEPALKDGQPVESRGRRRLEFQL
jgi:protein TonB